MPTTGVDREENFTAWLRFLHGLARARPAVLVFEDLQWAGEPMLAFLGHVVRKAEGVPLLVVGTARPEFLDEHPDAARFGDVLTRIDLRSLDAEESERLAASLSDVATRAHVRPLVARSCGGNPLFIEEFVRYLAERGGSGAGRVSLSPTPALDVPDSILSLIAARLDALPVDQKELLVDAAVVGQVFWPKALSVLGGRSLAVIERLLGRLEAREFVRRRRRSSVPGDREFAFWHALTQEVAYDQVPRRARAVKHAKLAAWMESVPGRGSPQRVHLLAHHYRLPMSWRASSPTMRWRGPSGNRPGRPQARGGPGPGHGRRGALRYYERAATMARPEDHLHAHVTVALAEAKLRSGRLEEAAQQLRQAVEQLRAAGELRAAAVAMTRSRTALYWSTIASRAPPRATCSMRLWRCWKTTVRPRNGWPCSRSSRPSAHATTKATQPWDRANRAIEESRRLGLRCPIRALAYRGSSLSDMGDGSGLADLRRAHELATGHDTGLDADVACHLLAETTYAFDGPDAAAAVAKRGRERATKRGEQLTSLWFRCQIAEFRRLKGDWRRSLRAMLELAPVVEERQPALLFDLRWNVAQIRLHQGEVAAAESLIDECRRESRASEADLLFLLPVTPQCSHRGVTYAEPVRPLPTSSRPVAADGEWQGWRCHSPSSQGPRGP